jgi:hypothetical protein
MKTLLDRKWKPGDTIVHHIYGEMRIVLIELCERQATFEKLGWRLKK